MKTLIYTGQTGRQPFQAPCCARSARAPAPSASRMPPLGELPTLSTNFCTGRSEPQQARIGRFDSEGSGSSRGPPVIAIHSPRSGEVVPPGWTLEEYEEALEDALNAQAENVVADKQINALVSKLKKILAAEKKKEKEAWGKVLGGGGGGGGGGGKKKGKK